MSDLTSADYARREAYATYSRACETWVRAVTEFGADSAAAVASKQQKDQAESLLQAVNTAFAATPAP